MNAFPIEIWAHITSFACTDAGFTARSLSGVCWDMNQIAEPLRYRVLGLGSIRQIINFCAFVRNNHTGSSHSATRQRDFGVRHLFIGCTNPRLHSPVDLSRRNVFSTSVALVRDLPSDVLAGLADVDGHDAQAHRSPPSGKVAVDDQLVLKAIAHILYSLSNTAITIHMSLLLHQYHNMALPFPFPVLRTLCMDGNYLFHPEGTEPLFPSLTQLRLGHFHALYKPNFAVIQPVIPKLHTLTFGRTITDDEYIADLTQWVREFPTRWPNGFLSRIIVEVESTLAAGDSSTPSHMIQQLHGVVERRVDYRFLIIQIKPMRNDLYSSRSRWQDWIYTMGYDKAVSSLGANFYIRGNLFSYQSERVVTNRGPFGRLANQLLCSSCGTAYLEGGACQQAMLETWR